MRGDKKKIIKIRFHQEILSLRNENMSWRDIAKYLGRYYNLTIHFSYLRTVVQPVAAATQPTRTAYDASRIDKVTGFSAERHDQLVNFFAELSDTDQINIQKLQNDLLRLYRGKTDLKGPEFYYAMFLMALHNIYNNRGFAENMPALADLPEGRKKKPGPKKEKLGKNIYELVGKLRDQGWSWRKISRNLGQYNRLKISHTWLKYCFEQTAAERGI